MKLFTLATLFSMSFAAQAIAQATQIEVIKTNGCGCCLAWMKHLEENGFEPTGEDMFAGLLYASNSIMAFRNVWCPVTRGSSTDM